jgi:hypothetical protein
LRAPRWSCRRRLATGHQGSSEALGVRTWQTRQTSNLLQARLKADGGNGLACERETSSNLRLLGMTSRVTARLGTLLKFAMIPVSSFQLFWLSNIFIMVRCHKN